MAIMSKCLPLAALALSALGLQVVESDHGLTFSVGGETLLTNTFLSGPSTDSVSPVPLGSRKRAAATAQWTSLSDNMVRVDISAEDPISVSGAAFSFAPADVFYGVWEYPFNGSI